VYQVVLADGPRRFFEKADAELQRRLDRAFEQLKVDPRRHANIRPLKGKLAGAFRYRVGDYRVVYRIHEQTKVVAVITIAHRRGVYG